MTKINVCHVYFIMSVILLIETCISSPIPTSPGFHQVNVNNIDNNKPAHLNHQRQTQSSASTTTTTTKSSITQHPSQSLHQHTHHVNKLHDWNIRKTMKGNCKCWTDTFQETVNLASTVLLVNATACTTQSAGTILQAIYYALEVDTVYKTEDEDDSYKSLRRFGHNNIINNKNDSSLRLLGKAYSNMHLCGLVLNESESYIVTFPRFSTYSIASEWVHGVLPVNQCNTWKLTDLDDDDYVFLDNILNNNSTNATSIEEEQYM